MARNKKSSRATGQARSRRAVEERNVSAASREPARDSSAEVSPADTGTASGGVRAPVALEAVITISEAAGLKDQLLPHVGRSGEIVIDGSRVEAVDTAALQVLLAFVRSARAHGAVIRWCGISGALRNTAQLLGVARLLGL